MLSAKPGNSELIRASLGRLHLQFVHFFSKIACKKVVGGLIFTSITGAALANERNDSIKPADFATC